MPGAARHRAGQHAIRLLVFYLMVSGTGHPPAVGPVLP